MTAHFLTRSLIVSSNWLCKTRAAVHVQDDGSPGTEGYQMGKLAGSGRNQTRDRHVEQQSMPTHHRQSIPWLFKKTLAISKQEMSENKQT